MNDFAIRAEKLSKLYFIGGNREKYRTLRDSLTDAAASSLRYFRSAFNGAGDGGSSGEGRSGDKPFWAIQDVSFEVKRGEVVGVIGRNGAGKSTLLKILARITEPTRGYADIRGRVGAMLEVGTGFHQELTGRENIYLSGAILGMKRDEINRKFDEIVEFAEVGKFIDTPMKRYSSGMYLRLAFSVAAHLEPEILLVDEVLAVGDVAFQKKCVGKMGDVASEGRTVLFVSHNLAVIKELCETSLVLNDGAVAYRGPVVQGLSQYSQMISATGSDDNGPRRGTNWRQLTLNGQEFGLAAPINKNDELFIEAWLDLGSDLSRGYLYCLIADAIGAHVVHQRIDARDLGYDSLDTGSYHVRVSMPPLWLSPGAYTVYFKFIGIRADGESETHTSERILLDVVGSAAGNSTALLAPDAQWSLESEAF
jgi:lipopolysaccharide transport system ATP-binding protein